MARGWSVWVCGAVLVVTGCTRRSARVPEGDGITHIETCEPAREWVCAPTCDNTLYDHAYVDGHLVCVPC